MQHDGFGSQLFSKVFLAPQFDSKIYCSIAQKVYHYYVSFYIYGVKLSTTTDLQQKGIDSGKDVSRKRRAKVAEEVPVDDTVREKVRRPARTATKETAEVNEFSML